MTGAAPARPAALRGLLALLFAFVVIKAASSDLTWDEAWTYLFYGRAPLGWTRLDYANDHPLNSVLVWAATRSFGNSEFIIRIPNVLAGALYLYSTAKLIGFVRGKLLAFALCVLQPYLFDYFALARGYGIAAALVQFGLVAHFFGTKPRPMLMLACCWLASLSVFSTVVALYALIAGLVAAASLGPSGGRWPGEQWPIVVGFAVLGLVPVAGLLVVSREGLPLYGSTAGFFDAIVRGVARMYLPNAWSTAGGLAVVLGVLALLLADARSMSTRAATLMLASAAALGATWLSARVAGKPLPTGRLLLPFVPLWNLAVLAMAEDVRVRGGPRARRAVQGAAVVLCVVLGVAFLGRLHFQRYPDWPEDHGLQNRLAQALAGGRSCLPGDVWDRYGHVYYLDRWFPPDRRPPDNRCPPP